MIIPPNRQWTNIERSSVKGSLWSTWNLDLRSNDGLTKLSPRTIVNTNNITDLGVAVGFDTFTDQNAGVQYFWAVAGGYVFRAVTTDAYITAFAKDASTGTPNNVCSSDSADIAHYGTTFMVVTSADDVYRFNSSSGQWNDGGNVLGSGVHMLCVYGDKFYVTASAGQKVYSFTPANYNAITTSSTNTLDLTNKSWNITTATCMRATSNRIWIGTLNQSENGCWVFSWDGSTANDPNEAYFIPDAAGVMAMVIKDDRPWIIDTNGRLMYFNGGSFAEAPNGRLPILFPKLLKNSTSSKNDRWIHPNGMQVVDGRIRILVNNEYADNGTTIEENFPSGVWEYDTSTGWIHVQSLSLYTSSVTDYGQNRVSRVGALYPVKDDSTTATANGTTLIGAQLFSNASSTTNLILYDDSNNTIQKYGYFVTTKIFSQNIQDVWQSVFLRFKKMLDSANSIVVKYRTNDVAATEATITWTSTSSFTSTASTLSAYAVGDEVEILNGTGGGKCAHISAISYNNPTYTVTLDDTFTGATGTAKARFQKWIKAGQTFSDQTSYFQQFSMQPQKTKGTWIQFKVCMQFKGDDELHDMTIINTKAE